MLPVRDHAALRFVYPAFPLLFHRYSNPNLKLDAETPDKPERVVTYTVYRIPCTVYLLWLAVYQCRSKQLQLQWSASLAASSTPA